MGESREGERGLCMLPCSLASAQRAFLGGDENLHGRKEKKKRRRKRSDRALKRKTQTL